MDGLKLVFLLLSGCNGIRLISSREDSVLVFTSLRRCFQDYGSDLGQELRVG